MKIITQERRVTSCFLQAIPPQIEHFDAYIYAIVPRRPEKVVPEAEFGTEVRIDPCRFNWDTKSITMQIPLDFNDGIESFDDIDPQFYESIEVAFVLLMQSCI
jgi:hypothetical protein